MSEIGPPEPERAHTLARARVAAPVRRAARQRVAALNGLQPCLASMASAVEALNAADIKIHPSP